jgi:peroxiredoxin
MRNFAFVLLLLVVCAVVLSCNKPPEEDASSNMPIAKPAPIESGDTGTPPPAPTATAPGGENIKTTPLETTSGAGTVHKDPLPAGFGDYEDINLKVDPSVNAYDFEAVDINGNTVKLADFRGNWVYIDFWATWCAPCMAELPNVAALQTKIPGLIVFGISLDDKGSTDKVKEVMTKNNMTIPQFIDADQSESIAEKYSVNPIPFSVLINPEGKIVMKAVRGEKMVEAIEQAMKG